MAVTGDERRAGPFAGYFSRDVPAPDPELTRVGPGTPCGEYLRRFWHPVAFVRDLGDTPRAIRILGEDLIVFRDRGECIQANMEDHVCQCNAFLAQSIQQFFGEMQSGRRSCRRTGLAREDGLVVLAIGGARLAAGVYYLRLSAGGVERTRTFTLLR